MKLRKIKILEILAMLTIYKIEEIIGNNSLLDQSYQVNQIRNNLPTFINLLSHAQTHLGLQIFNFLNKYQYLSLLLPPSQTQTLLQLSISTRI